MGKSSLLLRFADNTFSGESSWVLLGALILKSPTLSRAYLLLSDAGDFTIQVVGWEKVGSGLSEKLLLVLTFLLGSICAPHLGV